MVSQLTASDATTDETFALLADRNRQQAIRVLAEREDVISVSALAARIARRVFDSTGSDLPSETIERVHAALYHTHLPKLVAADAVTYDRETDRVGSTGHLDALVDVIEAHPRTR